MVGVVDSDPLAIKSHAANFPGARRVHGGDVSKLFTARLLSVLGLKMGAASELVGGPPFATLASLIEATRPLEFCSCVVGLPGVQDSTDDIPTFDIILSADLDLNSVRERLR